MIHYHGLPLSGRDVPSMSLQGKHAFVSFADPQPLALAAELCQSFALDNGAFSAWKSNKDFDIEGFACWVEEWYRHPGFDFYCMPDAIDGDDAANMVMRATWRNLIDGDIFRLGCPVWHLHEGLDTLEYLSRCYRRVAFGSSGDYEEIGTQKWWSRMGEAMEAVCDGGYPRCKLHGLRMLDPTVFSRFPFSSCDSTNVARNMGIDSAWKGTYTPASKRTRALVMMERIEQHASASRWHESNSIHKNNELFG